jgi:hypothetical protein
VNNWRVAGEGVNIKSGDEFEDLSTAIAITWIHEMGHYIQPCSSNENGKE